ncbi:hypothetical protein SPLC1_S190050 [Arthrospira platensis C1]|nr:hypothetical protein SPLC1_S190050 [Arthrospira platensis C1]
MGELKDRLAKIPREDGRWLLETLPENLWRASKTARLHQLLTDFDFMQAKLAECGVQALIEDYDLAMSSDVLLNPEQTETLQLIAGTLRLSTHILASDTTQLAEQLWGRLLSFENPEIVALLEQGKQWRGKPWFCPLTANLTPPGGPLIRTLTGHSSGVWAVAIAPDGKRAVSASYKTLKLWDLETGTELATLTGHSREVNAVAIAPDGKRAVSASGDNTLKLWDLETGTELATLTGHSDWVNAVAIAPDGKRAVSASDDKTLKLWDLETGTELATLRGHSVWVRAVAIAPDGKRAVLASDDNTLKLWDLERGTELVTLTGHSDPVNALAIAPVGN